jgi:hypothetical protein
LVTSLAIVLSSQCCKRECAVRAIVEISIVRKYQHRNLGITRIARARVIFDVHEFFLKAKRYSFQFSFDIWLLTIWATKYSQMENITIFSDGDY